MDSDTAAYAGHLRQARELTRHAVEAAMRFDKEAAGVWDDSGAIREAGFGNAGQAGQAADRALKLAPGSNTVELGAALALAMAGDTNRAEILAQDLNKRLPLDTIVQSNWLPTIDAQIELNKKNPSAAIDRLRAAAPIELGLVAFQVPTCLYPIYVRGEANLAAGNGETAAAEFQKILDHTGIALNCATEPLARLGLARAIAMQAQSQNGFAADAARAKARAAYQDFLTLWKDADPDIPVLKEARAEYASLN